VTAPWVAAQAVAEPRSDQLATVEKVLARIEPATGFALATDAAGTGLGVVFGVAERGWAGIFCMATRPDARRKGVATGLLHALAGWAAGQGAGRMYLQTYASNGPALALYAGAGFEPAYGYHYRRATPAVDSPVARAER
jgi:N-acetylglutamate synthase